MYQKFSILTYFCMKIFIFRHGLLTARLAKTTAHRVLFLVSMDSQRSKKFDGSHFWALGCLLTASGWLESIWAIMAPPPLSNVIPEPAQNRVKMALEWLFLNFVAIFNTLKKPWIAIFLKSTLIKV